MLSEQSTTIVVAVFVLCGLEMWRRALRGRAPRWVHVVARVLTIEIAVGVIYAEYRLFTLFGKIDTEAPANKATALAHGIADAMTANAVAIAGVVLDVVVLVIGTMIARRLPTAAPPLARVR